MELNKIFDRIKVLLQKKINELNSFNNIGNKIVLFLEKYNRDKSFDLELFKEISQKMDYSVDCSSLETKLDFMKKMEQSKDLFIYQLKVCEEEIEKIVKLVQITYETYTSNGILNKENINKTIEEYKKLYESLGEDNFEGFLNQDLVDSLLKFLDENNFNSEDKLAFIINITQSNIKFINREIKKEKIKTKRKTKVINSNPTNEEITDSYEEAKKIISENEENLLEDVFVNASLTQLNDCSSIEERIEIYESMEDLDVILKIIVADLKSNIMQMVENNIINLSDLEKILKIYKKYYESNESKNQQEEFNVFDSLAKLQLNDELDICIGASSLIMELQDFLINDYRGNIGITQEAYDELFDSFSKLKKRYEEFVNFFEYYTVEMTEENKELLDSDYEELKGIYEKAVKTKAKVFKTEEDNELLMAAREFYEYGDQTKNIYVFLDEDEDNFVSDVESSVLSDPSLNKKSLKFALQMLQQRVGQNFESTGDHKAKSGFYADDFLEKYKVKSMRSPNIRIFYSRFNTTLGKDFGYQDESPHVVFVLSVESARLDHNGKDKINGQALKKCYDLSKKIDKIVALLNSNWDSLSPEEKLDRQNKINNLLNQQHMKLGHMIVTSKDKGKGEK